MSGFPVSSPPAHLNCGDLPGVVTDVLRLGPQAAARVKGFASSGALHDALATHLDGGCDCRQTVELPEPPSAESLKAAIPEAIKRGGSLTFCALPPSALALEELFNPDTRDAVSRINWLKRVFGL